MSRSYAILTVLLALVGLVSCGRQPAQDYAVAGQLRFRPGSRFDMREVDRGRYHLELVMTARTSPDVGDVVAQRRWVNLGANHTFGLGKGRGQRIAKKGERVWITALIAVIEDRTGRPHQTWVGWTPEPVDLGRYDAVIRVDKLISDADPAAAGHPAGGWWSPSVVEESPPPGKESFDPGPRVFSGTIDLGLPAERADIRKSMGVFPLYVFARPRLRGPPALVTRYELPIYPVRFALHQNHRVDGTTEPVTDPMFVEAVLDLDGNVGTKDDQIRAATTEAVDPLKDDIAFKFDESELRALLQRRFGAGAGVKREPATSQPSGGNPSLATGRAVAAGRIELEGDAPTSAVGWLTVKVGGQTKLTKKLDPKTGFPLSFTIGETDHDGGRLMRVDTPFIVSVTLAELADNGRRWRAVSTEQTSLGVQGLRLALQKQ